MIKINFGQIASAIDAELINLDSSLYFVGEVVIDSRKIKPGDLFVAIEGEKFDGHDFIADAIKSGACAVISSKRVDDFPQLLVTQKSSAPEIYSQPTIWALAKLANFVHQKLSGLITIAITGSSGKTTTKDLIAQLSGLLGEAVYTEGSSNNEIGLPLTIFKCSETTKVLILEMGARHTGNIKYLTDIARPNYGIITHIGSAHLEIFGSLENLRNTKAEIIKDIAKEDWAILNLDDQNTLQVKNMTRAKIFTFGSTPKADLYATNIEVDEMGHPSFDMHFKDQNVHIELNLVGEHNVSNALAAAAPYLLENKSLKEVANLLNSAKALNPLRMEVSNLRDDIILLNDSYNANPESMKAALQTLERIGKGKRKIAILGEMRELGISHEEFHEAIGLLAGQIEVDKLLVVGERAKGIVTGAKKVDNWKGEATFHENNHALADYAKELLKPKDVILIKASRALALEEVADELIQFKGKE